MSRYQNVRIELLVSRVTDCVYSYQAMTARMSCEANLRPVMSPPAPQRDIVEQLAAREIVSAVCDAGFHHDLLPVDSEQVDLTVDVSDDNASVVENSLIHAAAFGVLAWINGGIDDGLANKFKNMRNACLHDAGRLTRLRPAHITPSCF